MAQQNASGLARIYFPREPDANPYYTANRQLRSCAVLAQELAQAGVCVTRLQGGHRSGLQADCQLTALLADEDALRRFCAPHGACWELL